MGALNIFLYILSALLGLAVGSFLNVCIYRLPIGKFWSKARSFCPKCGAPIKAYDNIPLISYIILRGKCRACHEPISPRYPIIEALNMILWIVNYAVFGMTYLTIIYDLLASTLIVIAMIDYDTTEIMDSSIIAIIIMGLITFIPVFGMDWKSKLIGAFCVSVPMFILAFFGLMGMGDAKLFFALGLLFGWEKILVVFIISFVIGTIGSLINLAIIKRRSREIQPANGESECNNIIDNIGESEGEIEHTKCTPVIENNPEIYDKDAINDETTVDSIPVIEEGEKTRTKVALDMNASDEEYERQLEEKLESGHAIPFGPFIVIAGVITMYLGDLIIEGYMGLMGF